MRSVLHRFALLVAAGGLLVGACSSGGGGPKSRGVLTLGKDGVGTCLQVGDKIDAEVSKLPTIDCSKEHTHEIYAVVVLTDAEYPVYPGTEALDKVAQRECTTDFKPYVGSGPFDSNLFFSWLLPTLGSWNDHSDRTVLCVASRFDNGPLVGTIKNSHL